jgi:hypothetical protein
MPQVDVQWPSEDEDFDAKTDTNSSKTAVKAKPSLTKVDDQQPEPEEPAEETAPAAVDEAPEEQAPEEEPAAPEAPASEDPAPADESSSQPDPSPVIQQEAAALASSVDNDQGAVSEVPVASKRPKMPELNRGVLRLAGEAVLIVAVIGLGLWSWSLYSDRKDLQSQVTKLNINPQSVVQKQTQQLITKVGSLMQLPSGETPTVAEVSDATQAKQQSSFFANAQNGDRVLMYVKAGEAILYRPSTNKIILVAPLVFTNNGASTSSTNKSATTTPTTTGTTSTKSTTGR